MMLYHAINLFIYELAASKLKAAGGEDYMRARLDSLHGLLEYFLKFTADEVFNLPVFQFTRVSRALFTLFGLKQTISDEQLRLPLYMDGVLALLRESGRKGSNEGLHWNLVLVAALREWTQKEPLRVLSDVAAVEGKMVTPPKDAKNALDLVIGDGVEAIALEHPKAFFRLLEETAAREGR